MIIRFAGFGGQGIVLASYIMGQAATFDGKKALQNQSYGSESRGGECRGDVVISNEDINELEPTRFDVLVAMTQPAYDKFLVSLKSGGTLIFDKDLVIAGQEAGLESILKYGVSATEVASKQLGKKIAANMIMLGFLNTLLNLVSGKALEKAILKNVPRGTEELNLKAMRLGIELAGQEKTKIKSRH